MSGALIRAPQGVDEGLDLTPPHLSAGGASGLPTSLLRQETRSKTSWTRRALCITAYEDRKLKFGSQEKNG